ncbi:MAG: hypothetical protein ACXVRV_04245 [Gaiellaceae bacterium]
MTARLRVRGRFRRKPLTGDQLRAIEEAGLAKDHLRDLKAGSHSLDSPAGQQPGAAVGASVSKVQRAAEDAVETATPQQQEREEFGTEL